MLEPRRAKPQQRRRKSKCQCVMLCKGSRVVERLRRPLPAFCLEMVGYLMWWFVSGERLRRQSPFHLLLHPIEQFHNDRSIVLLVGRSGSKVNRPRCWFDYRQISAKSIYNNCQRRNQDTQEGTDLRFHVSAEKVLSRFPCRERRLKLKGTGRQCGPSRIAEWRRCVGKQQ